MTTSLIGIGGVTMLGNGGDGVGWDYYYYYCYYYYL